MPRDSPGDQDAAAASSAASTTSGRRCPALSTACGTASSTPEMSDFAAAGFKAT
jgi:hypothetical protein